MEALPGGVLSVPLGEDDVLDAAAPAGSARVALAQSTPQLSVVSGRLARSPLRADAGRRRHRSAPVAHITCLPLTMMDSILSPFAEVMRSVRLNPPAIPTFQCRGTWITAGRAGPRTMRSTSARPYASRTGSVLAEEPSRAAGGRARTRWSRARQHGAIGHRAVVASLPGPAGTRTAAAGDLSADDQAALMALGRLWLAGITPGGILQGQPGHPGRPSMRTRNAAAPTYPFGERYWVTPSTAHGGAPRRRL